MTQDNTVPGNKITNQMHHNKKRSMVNDKLKETQYLIGRVVGTDNADECDGRGFKEEGLPWPAMTGVQTV